MAHKNKCANCGHKIEVKDGELIHSSPHPSHVCKCKEIVPNERKVNRVKAGISTYTGYLKR